MKKTISLIIIINLFVVFAYSQTQKKTFAENSVALTGKNYLFVNSDERLKVEIIESTNILTNLKTNAIQLSFLDAAQFEKEQVEFNSAKREVDRAISRLETGDISRVEYDKAKDRFDIAQINLRNSKKNLVSNSTIIIGKNDIDKILKSFSILQSRIWNPASTLYREISFVVKNDVEFVTFFAPNEKRWIYYLKLSNNNTNSIINLTKENIENLQKFLRETKHKLL